VSAATLETFELPAALEAREPPELTLGRRDAVRMLVSIGDAAPKHTTARDLATWLSPGDLVVVNTSATMPAAVDATTPAGESVVVHLSTELPTGLHLVEVRRPASDGTTEPDFDDRAGETLALPAGGAVHLLGRMPSSVRLWVATLDLPAPLTEYLCRHGRPIRYRYVPATWPIEAYTNAFATEPGSAEMPSAGRVLTTDVITDLVAHGILVAPIVLHTGVASLEAHETPYPERYRVPPTTARLVNETLRAGHFVVAVGTTVVRALETVADEDGLVHPGEGWTELVVTPERGVRAVDGLLTGWHEPQASHLRLLEAVAGRPALELAYATALAAGYRWHEFGDVHLILPRSPAPPAVAGRSLAGARSLASATREGR
jgi:S-adenosylmethionine:tRNA ribosyltransferase-isomerase